MSQRIQFLDVIALREDLSEGGLKRGQVGTVVAQLASNVYGIESNNDDGRTYAMAALPADQLMVLPYQLSEMA